MITIRREENQWIEIEHKSGDVIRLTWRETPPGRTGINITFDDVLRNFRISRPKAQQPS